MKRFFLFFLFLLFLLFFRPAVGMNSVNFNVLQKALSGVEEVNYVVSFCNDQETLDVVLDGVQDVLRNLENRFKKEENWWFFVFECVKSVITKIENRIVFIKNQHSECYEEESYRVPCEIKMLDSYGTQTRWKERKKIFARQVTNSWCNDGSLMKRVKDEWKKVIEYLQRDDTYKILEQKEGVVTDSIVASYCY
ncbi:hypothetical protein KKA53_01385 [Candidatus Dependentiae bacterium]|nr:hypothetical protein [Candidatus Dependentiae bacterium]